MFSLTWLGCLVAVLLVWAFIALCNRFASPTPAKSPTYPPRPSATEPLDCVDPADYCDPEEGSYAKWEDP